jgi:hypothetical protein
VYICDPKCSKPRLGGGKLEWPGLSAGGSTWSDPGNDHRLCAICDIISANSGLGGGVWSNPRDGNSPSSSESHRFCDTAPTSLVTSALRRSSGLSRTATGAAGVRLMMESIRRTRLSMLCCRIFVRCGVD